MSSRFSLQPPIPQQEMTFQNQLCKIHLLLAPPLTCFLVLSNLFPVQIWELPIQFQQPAPFHLLGRGQLALRTLPILTMRLHHLLPLLDILYLLLQIQYYLQHLLHCLARICSKHRLYYNLLCLLPGSRTPLPFSVLFFLHYPQHLLQQIQWVFQRVLPRKLSVLVSCLSSVEYLKSSKQYCKSTLILHNRVGIVVIIKKTLSGTQNRVLFNIQCKYQLKPHSSSSW